MHPIERLRYVARAGGAPPSSLVSEAAAALAGLADDPAALVTACRRLVERHPHVGPMWWLASRVLTSPEPAEEAWRVVEELEHDRTSRLLAAALGESAAVVVLGWPELAGSAVMRRGDLAVMLVDPFGEADGLSRRLRSAGGDVLEVPLSGLAQAVAAADVVLVEAMALGGEAGWADVPDKAGPGPSGPPEEGGTDAGVVQAAGPAGGTAQAGGVAAPGGTAVGTAAQARGAARAGAPGGTAVETAAQARGPASAGGAAAEAAAPGGAVVAAGSWAAAAVARSVGVPTWLVAGAGRVLPARIWEALVLRLDDYTTEPWDRVWEVLPADLMTSVAGPEGLGVPASALGRGAFPVAPELLVPVEARGI